MSLGSSHNEDGLKGITKDLRRYVEKRLELLVLAISERVSYILADSIQRIIGILLFAGGLFFLWFALGFYLGSLVESLALGFLICSVPLIIAGLIFIRFKPKSITEKIQAGMMHEIILSLDQMDKKVQAEPKKEEDGESSMDEKKERNST